MQARYVYKGRNPPGFESQDKRDQESKAWVSMARQKGPMSPIFYKQNPNTQLDDRISISTIENSFGQLGTFTKMKLVKKETIYLYL